MIISIICIIVIGLFTYWGWKKGIIRSAVSLIGTVAVSVIAWSLKDVLGNFFIEHLPFFNFSGIFNGISSINIIIYKALAFLILFVLLYCLLNILISLAKLTEKILKITVVFALPSKILGALLGFIEGVVTVFLFLFLLYHFPLTTQAVNNSKVAIIVLERTPIIGELAVSTTLSLEDIDKILLSGETKDSEEANFKVLHTLIYYKIISAEDAQKLIDSNKLKFNNTTIVK